jgi:hypothetical protein
MMSVNATVRLRFRNRGTFFGLHVSATPFHLFFDDLTVASGNVRAPSCHCLFAFASAIRGALSQRRQGLNPGSFAQFPAVSKRLTQN